jgi:hypothetical protein
MPRSLGALLLRSLRFVRRQPLVVAVTIACAISVVLAAVVLAPLWAPVVDKPSAPAVGAAMSSSSDEPPAALAPTVQPAATSTPWPRRPRAPTPTPEATSTAAPTARSAARTSGPTRTPSPAASATPSPTPTPATSTTYYLAEAGAGLERWSGPHWRLDDGRLVNDGSGVQAQQWLAAPEPALVEGGYAVEAELQISDIASGFCEQNFGVVAVSADGRAYFGGGLLYYCDGGEPVARITDVTNWTDGYNRDPTLSSARFDLGPGWHTFRLEVEPGHVRLLIDGEVVVEADDPASGEADPRAVEIGLWSQGVELSVRRVKVEPLPDDV